MAKHLVTVEVEQGADGRVRAFVRDGAAPPVGAEVVAALRELADEVEQGAAEDAKDRARHEGLAALRALRELNEQRGITEPTPDEAIAEVRALRAARPRAPGAR